MLRERLDAVEQRIAAALARCGRSRDEITLVAVTKVFPASAIVDAYQLGLRDFGENYVQEFEGKAPQVSSLAGARFHLIGHLQSNKAKTAVELFDAVDSLDSIALGEKLNAAAAKPGKVLPVLLELNVGGEESKSGLRPDSPDIDALLDAAAAWEHLAIRGLMSIPPFREDPEAVRPFFRVLRQYWDKIAARKLPHVRMDVLSIGMSHDFEVAIEEGSTCVRVGTAVFGERAPR